MLDYLFFVSCFSVLRFSFLGALPVGICLSVFAGDTHLLTVSCCDACLQDVVFVVGCVLVSSHGVGWCLG